MKVIGLISGTSSDGIDAALVEIDQQGHRIRLIDFAITPYPRQLQRALIDLSAGMPQSVAKVCHLNFYLGERFADAAIQIAQKANIALSDIDLIGSHGQTVHHLPTPKKEGKWDVRSTLQIGEPSVIAERTGITTIADFRPRDIAAGGEGAPLTPFLHFRLFSHSKKSRAIVNIGGISNVTYLTAKGAIENVRAFDTGPGNMLIDGLVRARTGKPIDRDGKIAGRGSVDRAILSDLMRNPYIRKKPPKSTGRERFGLTMLGSILKKYKTRPTPDLIATVSAFTAMSIAYNIRQFILAEGSLDEVIVGGGGVHNPIVMKFLSEQLSPIPVVPFEMIGMDSRAIEAMTFALLAYHTARNEPTGLPAVTGARESAILGKIVPGRKTARPANKG